MGTDELIKRVCEAIDDEVSFNAWLPKTKNGAIGAVQFLSVILWATRDDEQDHGKDRKIIEAWSKKLLDSTTERWSSRGPVRMVRPFDPVTYLEISDIPKDWDWVLSVDDADDFLEDCGRGFKCSYALAYLRGEDSPYGELEPVVSEDTAIKAHPTKVPVQDEALLCLLKKEGFNPKDLPERPKGRSGVKAQVKKIALQTPGLFSKKSFDNTWARLRGDGRIVGSE